MSASAHHLVPRKPRRYHTGQLVVPADATLLLVPTLAAFGAKALFSATWPTAIVVGAATLPIVWFMEL